MAEHQLSSEDVALIGIDASKVKAANSSERQPKWSLLLVSLVRQAFGVEAIMCHDRPQGFLYRNTAGDVYRPSGSGGDRRLCHTVLARQLKAARAEYVSTLSKRMKTSTKRPALICSVRAGATGLSQDHRSGTDRAGEPAGCPVHREASPEPELRRVSPPRRPSAISQPHCMAGLPQNRLS